MATWKEEQKLKEYLIRNPNKQAIQPEIDAINASFKELSIQLDLLKTWHENLPEKGAVMDVDGPMFNSVRATKDLYSELKALWDKLK